MPSTAIKFTKEFQRVINNRREAIRVAKQFKREKTNLNMNWYASGLEDDDGDPRFDKMSEAELAMKKGACGTSVCLAGRMALEPYFKKQGISLTLDEQLEVAGDIDSEDLGLQQLLCTGPAEEIGDKHDFIDDVFYSHNEIDANGRIDKKATLDRIIGVIKTDTRKRYGVVI